MPITGGPLSGPPGGVTLTLQADFSGTAFGGSPTWTDITAWWMSSGVDPGGGPVTIPWGRQDQSSVVESSSTSFTLNNADGRFTPGRSTLVTGGANPYYPNVRRHGRMRLTCTDGTTTVVLVDGLVDAWVVTPQTDGPTLAAAELTDVFGRVSASTALRSIYVEEILHGTPAVTGLYPLDDAVGSLTAGDLVANASARFVQSKYGGGSVTFGAPSIVAADGATAVTSFTPGGTQGWARGVPVTTDVISTVRSFSVSGWFATTSTTGGTLALLKKGSAYIAAASLDASGHAVAGIDDGFGALSTITGTVAYNDGLPHFLTMQVYKAIAGAQFRCAVTVDGVTIVRGANLSGFFTYNALQLFGEIDAYVTGNVLGGTYQGWAYWQGVPTTDLPLLSDPTIASLRTAGLNAFAGESTATRWTRLATYRPNLGVASSGTVGAVGSRDSTGMSLGDAFTDTATAEGGVIETHRGTLRLIGRSGNRNPTTTVTLNAANSEVDIPTTWRDDTQGFLNDVTVTRANGATQRVTSAASIAADGVSQTSIDANVNSDRDAADMAGWTAAIGTQDELTSPTLTVNLNANKNAALTLAVCALRTFDIVTLTNLPASAPATTMSLQAQGGQVTVGADTFTATINTSAKPPQILQVKATADATTALDTGNVVGW